MKLQIENEWKGFMVNLARISQYFSKGQNISLICAIQCGYSDMSF
jgi:hypothetical protein